MNESHVAIYLRVSTRQQNTKSQEPDLERWAKTQDGRVGWYRDKFTGKTMARPAWSRLEQAIHDGHVTKVVVWRLDRLGRTARGLTALFEDLLSRKIGLVSLKDGLDLNTAAGRLMAHILASVAQYETELRAERVLAGQAKARADGKRWGGSSPGRQISVTDDQIAILKKMKREEAKIAAMARATGLSRPTVYRLLERHTEKQQ